MELVGNKESQQKTQAFNYGGNQAGLYDFAMPLPNGANTGTGLGDFIPGINQKDFIPAVPRMAPNIVRLAPEPFQRLNPGFGNEQYHTLLYSGYNKVADVNHYEWMKYISNDVASNIARHPPPKEFGNDAKLKAEWRKNPYTPAIIASEKGHGKKVKMTKIRQKINVINPGTNIPIPNMGIPGAVLPLNPSVVQSNMVNNTILTPNMGISGVVLPLNPTVIHSNVKVPGLGTGLVTTTRPTGVGGTVHINPITPKKNQTVTLTVGGNDRITVNPGNVTNVNTGPTGATGAFPMATTHKKKKKKKGGATIDTFSTLTITDLEPTMPGARARGEKNELVDVPIMGGTQIYEYNTERPVVNSKIAPIAAFTAGQNNMEVLRGINQRKLTSKRSVGGDSYSVANLREISTLLGLQHAGTKALLIEQIKAKLVENKLHASHT